MSIFQLLGDLAIAAADGIGTHQMTQQQQTGAKRVVRRKESCTPCAAMAAVDQTRTQLGFGTKKAQKAKKK
jgi:hypothetical protein